MCGRRPTLLAGSLCRDMATLAFYSETKFTCTAASSKTQQLPMRSGPSTCRPNCGRTLLSTTTALTKPCVGHLRFVLNEKLFPSTRHFAIEINEYKPPIYAPTALHILEYIIYTACISLYFIIL
jgi:hypothetical protein